MVDYQQSRYPIYDHHYRQKQILSDHVHSSWYTPPPGDFEYFYGDVGGASTSGGTFGPGAQGDNDDDDDDESDD